MCGDFCARSVLSGVKEGEDLVLGDGSKERPIVRPLETVSSVSEICESSGALLILNIPNSHSLIEAGSG